MSIPYRRSSRPIKFWCGKPIKDLATLDSVYDAWCRRKDTHEVGLFVMVGTEWKDEGQPPKHWPHPKAQHIAWVMNQSHQRLRALIKGRSIHFAEMTPAYREWLQAQLREGELHPTAPILTESEAA